MQKLYFLLLVIVVATSCASRSNVAYYQDSDQFNNVEIPLIPPTIQRNDILSVRFSSVDPLLVAPYNKQITMVEGQTIQRNLNLIGYLVSEDYKITLPNLGDIDVKDKTPKQLATFLRKKMIDENRLTDTTVEVILLNGKFTVMGEVNRPGTFTMSEPNLTLPQALGLAGDLTINGKRKNIIITRENNGVQTVGNIDLTSGNIINSPFYYIRPNDFIYVEPNGPRITSSGYVNNLSTILSIASIILTATVVIVNVSN